MVVKRGSLQDNIVIGLDSESELNQLAFKGTQNKIFFHEKAVSKGCNILFVGSGGVLEVHAGAVIQGDFLIGEQARITIGAKTLFNKRCILRATTARTIQIGQDCLLANVKFATMDDLPIYDRLTSKRVNPATDIVVGDRVWIAEHVQVGAGATIGHDSVIGAWSMVNSTIPSHCIAAGNPAQVVKTNVVWKK